MTPATSSSVGSDEIVPPKVSTITRLVEIEFVVESMGAMLLRCENLVASPGHYYAGKIDQDGFADNDSRPNAMLSRAKSLNRNSP